MEFSNNIIIIIIEFSSSMHFYSCFCLPCSHADPRAPRTRGQAFTLVHSHWCVVWPACFASLLNGEQWVGVVSNRDFEYPWPELAWGGAAREGGGGEVCVMGQHREDGDAGGSMVRQLGWCVCG